MRAEVKTLQCERIVAHGWQALIDWHIGPLTSDFESTLRPVMMTRERKSHSQLQLHCDPNVGLLPFEHILAFESARSAGVVGLRICRV